MYVILELQVINGNIYVVTPIQTAETQNEAMSKYHGILSSAAISSVPIHSAIVMNERAEYVAKETYEHITVEPAGE